MVKTTGMKVIILNLRIALYCALSRYCSLQYFLPLLPHRRHIVVHKTLTGTNNDCDIYTQL